MCRSSFAGLSSSFGFHAQVVFENWLAGLQVMQSQVTVSGDVCPLGVTSKLSLSGTGAARFSPVRLMEIGGPGIATISGLGPALPTATFSLKQTEKFPPSYL